MCQRFGIIAPKRLYQCVILLAKISARLELSCDPRVSFVECTQGVPRKCVVENAPQRVVAEVTYPGAFVLH